MTPNQPAWRVWHDGSAPIRVGISSCLLGRKVCYDGDHKHDRYLTDVLGTWLDWASVCPEVEIGLGTPRPAIRLEGAAADPRLVEPVGGEDLTERMRAYAERRVGELRDLDLDGYVLKRASPSCGMERVKVWSSSGMPEKSGIGIFAAYEDEFFAVLATKANVKRHTNVLQHAVGYLKKVLEPGDRRELLDLIEDYRAGLVPLVIPITMLRHHVHRNHVDYLNDQLYLEPHPKELMLRNRV